MIANTNENFLESKKTTELRGKKIHDSQKKKNPKKIGQKLKENTNIRNFIKGTPKIKCYEDEEKSHKLEPKCKEKKTQTDPVTILDEPPNKPDDKTPPETSTPSKQKPIHATSTPNMSTNDNNDDHDDIEKEIMRLGEDSDEVYKMLTGEDIPEGYWKMLAESRREALDESLCENKELHDKVDTLNEELDKIKMENSVLIEILTKNESYSAILEDVLEKERQGLLKNNEEEEEDN